MVGRVPHAKIAKGAKVRGRAVVSSETHAEASCVLCLSVYYVARSRRSGRIASPVPHAKGAKGAKDEGRAVISSQNAGRSRRCSLPIRVVM